MTAHGCHSSARALYAIYTTPFYTRLAPTSQLARPQRLAHTPISQRNLNVWAKAVNQGALQKQKFDAALNDPHRPLDEKIGAPKAHLVDDNGKLQDAEPLHRLLANIDRGTQHIRKLGETNGIPVVRVVEKEALYAEIRATIEPKKKEAGPKTKQIELTWGIFGNDLHHRLQKIEEILRDGNKVEVLIAPKRRGRKTTGEENEALLSQLREAIKEVPEAEEWKGMEGAVGAQVVLYVRGKVVKDSTEEAIEIRSKDPRTEKYERKEREKREAREKQEKRLREKKEFEEERKKRAMAI